MLSSRPGRACALSSFHRPCAGYAKNRPSSRHNARPPNLPIRDRSTPGAAPRLGADVALPKRDETDQDNRRQGRRPRRSSMAGRVPRPLPQARSAMPRHKQRLTRAISAATTAFCDASAASTNATMKASRYAIPSNCRPFAKPTRSRRDRSASQQRNSGTRAMKPCGAANCARRARRSGLSTATMLQACMLEDVAADCATATNVSIVPSDSGSDRKWRTERWESKPRTTSFTMISPGASCP